MSQLSHISIVTKRRKELKIDINEELKPTPLRCIYRVPKNLRKMNQQAYTPQLVSIGPFHHGKKELVEMEKQKVRYYNDFGGRITEEKWERILTFIKDKEKCIRDCYEETFKFKSEKFITMILFDAIFIIELLLKKQKEEGDYLLDQPSLDFGIKQDLLLLENQLPLFVLKKLYKLAIVNPCEEVCEEERFINLSSKFFGYDKPDPKLNERNLKHFVDLRRNSLVKVHPESTSKGFIRDLPNAVKLHESGVKFKMISGNPLLDIKFQKGKRFIPFFSGDELHIPNIIVEDGTECLLRNMMALEQCHYPSETHICNYIQLIDSLINTEKDVDFLVEKRIITNFVGSHAAIARMFNKLGVQITPSPSCYKDIGDNLKKYHRRWWNRTKATLMSVYFSNLWRGTGTVAATILLVLTLLQTIYTMRP